MTTSTDRQRKTLATSTTPTIVRGISVSIGITILLAIGSCANVDRNLMKVSNAISSPDPVTGAREITLMSEQAEIRQGAQSSQKIMQEIQKKGLRRDGQLPEFSRSKMYLIACAVLYTGKIYRGMCIW